MTIRSKKFEPLRDGFVEIRREIAEIKKISLQSIEAPNQMVEARGFHIDNLVKIVKWQATILDQLLNEQNESPER